MPPDARDARGEGQREMSGSSEPAGDLQGLRFKLTALRAAVGACVLRVKIRFTQ